MWRESHQVGNTDVMLVSAVFMVCSWSKNSIGFVSADCLQSTLLPYFLMLCLDQIYFDPGDLMLEWVVIMLRQLPHMLDLEEPAAGLGFVVSNIDVLIVFVLQLLPS